MKFSFLPAVAFAASVTASALAADPAPTPEEVKKKEEIRALILSDASKASANAPAPAAKPAPADAPKPDAGAAPAPSPETKPADPTATAKQEEATMLPQMEVNKSRITDIDIAIKEQDRAIAREKQNVKPTKLDDTLNNSKVSKALAIFGGSSSDSRSGIAQERIRLMEEEKELLESLRLARTKEEKAELQTELDALRAERRELDRAPK